MDTGIEKNDVYGYTLTYFTSEIERCEKGIVFAPNFPAAMQKICDAYGEDCVDMIRIWTLGLGGSLVELSEIAEDKNFTEEKWLQNEEVNSLFKCLVL